MIIFSFFVQVFKLFLKFWILVYNYLLIRKEKNSDLNAVLFKFDFSSKKFCNSYFTLKHALFKNDFNLKIKMVFVKL